MQNDKNYKFQVIISMPFQKKLEMCRDKSFRKTVFNRLDALAKGFESWSGLGVKDVDFARTPYPLRLIRIDKETTLLFEGAIPSRRFGPVLFVHDLCNDNDLAQSIKRINELGEATRVFSKPIPMRALHDPDVLDVILSTEKANLLLTRRQCDVLYADTPLLIHGQAGSGKTTILCHRLALSLLSQRNNPQAKFVFLSYNERLIRQAMMDTKEILRYHYFVKDNLEKVKFITFQNFLKQYVQNPERFGEDRYVPYGRFKHYYEKYRWGSTEARRIPAEVAWHAIRSILKGACKPPQRPPISIEEYKKLARRRREFPEDIFNDVYEIGKWYQREIIYKKGLWDDQDLAWEALNWIWKEKERNPNMELYDEIFCDEVQDLTEIEFLLLVALCKQSFKGVGPALILAGDPLQTINPTGFRWETVRSEIYTVQGKSVDLKELQENFRSDKKIVTFANRIQEVRSHYLKHKIEPQIAFEKDGEIPQVFIVEEKDEVSIISDKLGELPPESAIIIWPEESDDVEQFCKSEEPLSKIDRKLDLYTIPEAKGLEFNLVILYKFGSSPDALKWRDYIVKPRQPSLEDEIPLLYFLNRLYVAVTRAKLFLIIIDTKQGVDNFWSIWKDSLHIIPRAEARKLIETHPAFLGEVKPAAWYKWAEVLFEHAERTYDLRLFERAKRAYEKAGETQMVKLVDAKLAEISEDYKKAAIIYNDLNNFEKAGNCYEKALMWGEAFEEYAKLPTTPETKKRMAICKFKRDVNKNPLQASKEFYEYAIEDETLERRYLEELADVLVKTENYEMAAQILLRIARKFKDKVALKQAALLFYKAGNFEAAEALFVEAEETKVPEYELSRAENLLRRNEWYGAAELFFKNNAFDRVIATYEQASLKGVLTDRLIEMAADSYFNLQMWGRAYGTYETLISITKREDPQILERMAECLEKLNEKRKAMDYYRRAGLYAKAGILAEELGLSREKVLELKIRGACQKKDFDSAIKFAQELGDEKRVHILRGQKHKHKAEYREAIKEFLAGDELIEAINCLNKAELSYSEQYSEMINILKAVITSQKKFKLKEKERIMMIVRRVQEDPVWEQHIQPPDMGLIYEKCATFIEAAYYYERYINEKWAQDGWIRVKTSLRDLYKKKGQIDRAEKTDEEIRQRKTQMA